MKKVLRKILIKISVLLVVISITALNSFPQSIIVDYAVKIDPPLFKKFDQYNAGCINPYSNYNRDLDKLSEVDAHSLRIDLGIGKTDCTFSNPQVVKGTPTNITYDFRVLDDLVAKLNARKVLPFWSWCYIPVPLQDGGDWTNLKESIPNWPDLFREIHRQYASHFKSAGLRIGYHEIGNEPDLFGVFLKQDDFNNRYFEMYKNGALGIKDGDPDAVVGGPAYAIGESIPANGGFLDYVKTNKLPLDFCSFHSYLDGTSWPGEMDGIADGLDRRGFKTTDILIDEFSWLNTANGGNAGATSAINFYAAASRTLETMNTILKRTDVTFINWAQFMESTFGDDPYGIIRKDGHRKAVFNAFKIYADMPVERNSMKISNRYINGWASSSPHKVCLAFWNNGKTAQQIDVKLNNIPFADGNFRLYRIDSLNASYFSGAHENLEVVESQNNIDTGTFSWSGSIPEKGVVYMVIKHNSEFQDFSPDQYNNFFAKDIRTIHYYPVRKKTYYAEFDRKRWIAYLGMGTNDNSLAQVGVEAESLPEDMEVQFVKDGTLKTIDKNSLLGLRLDFRVAGVYTKSILFHGEFYDPARDAEMAWGTKLQAEEVKLVNDSSFVVHFADYAPTNWDGRVFISFIMQNLGENTRTKVILKDPATLTSIQKINRKNDDLLIFPNPTSDGIFHIRSKSILKKENYTITICDLPGRVCYSGKLKFPEENRIDTNDILKPGMYLLSLTGANRKTSIQKIIIQN